MRDIEVKISKETRKVDLNQSFIGNDAENLQSNIVFSFKDDFVNGVASLEYSVLDEKRYAMLEKEGESYKIPIKSVLTKKGSIPMQLVITEPGEYVLTEDEKYLEAKKYFSKVGNIYNELIPGTDYEVGDDIVGDIYECINVPIFKSNVFYVYVNESINAEAIEPEEYYSWIVIANQKLIEIDEALEQVDNLDIDAQRVEGGVEVTITKKDGTTKVVEIYDGESEGTYNYEELENKPQINGHTLIGNQTSEELGIETYDDTEVWNAISEHDRDIQNIENDIDTIEQDIDDLGTELDNLDLNKQDKLTAGQNISIVDNVISATGSGGTLVNIGSYQYTYEGYVLPAISVNDARTIYNNDKLGIQQILVWTIYGNESQFKVVSSDEIAGTYSFDILVHNKYHCAYEWTEDTTGVINPTVQAGGEGGNVDDVQLNGVSILQNKVANILASTNISDTPSDDKLVTEKTIYDYVASGNDGKTRTLDGVDLNTITNTGFYSCNVCTNRPTENNGVMLILKNGFSSDNLVQIYWTFVADVMWARHKDLGNWKEWKKISNLSASDIKASNLQTVQQNLERIDERIDSLDSIAMIPESSTYISTGTTGSNYLKIMEVLNRYFSNKAGDTAQIFYNDELYSFKYTYLSSQTSDYVRVLVYFISQKNSMTQIKYGMSFKQAPKTLYLDVYVKPSEYSTQSITELFGNSSLSSNDIKFTIEPSSNLYYSVKGDFLGLNNTTPWNPTGDYQPSTKKYVDDSIGNAIEGEY